MTDAPPIFFRADGLPAISLVALGRAQAAARRTTATTSLVGLARETQGALAAAGFHLAALDACLEHPDPDLRALALTLERLAPLDRAPRKICLPLIHALARL